MRILILGGTGAIGILLIRDALAHGHTVTVYARSPDKLPEDIRHETAVVIIRGELHDEEQLSKAVEGVDAVLSALGPAVSRGPLYPRGAPIAKAYARIIAIMRQHAVKRLIVLGTTSIKDPNDKFSAAFWAIISGVALLAYTAYCEFVAIGETIRASELDWTIVRVPVLTSHDNKEVIAGYVGDGKTKTTLTRAGFSSFTVKELEKNEWTKKAPLISSP